MNNNNIVTCSVNGRYIVLIEFQSVQKLAICHERFIEVQIGLPLRQIVLHCINVHHN